MKSLDALQNGSFQLTQRLQNLELVNLKCVTYAKPIPLHCSCESSSIQGMSGKSNLTDTI